MPYKVPQLNWDKLKPKTPDSKIGTRANLDKFFVDYKKKHGTI